MKPNLLAHLPKQTRTTNESNIQNEKPDKFSCQQSQGPPKGKFKADAFDGDDLGLDDFFLKDLHQEKPKEPASMKKVQDEEIDWLSIDSTPSPKRRPAASKATGSESIADMGPQEQAEDEPVRLANGNWACNHKCKDKTRYVLLQWTSNTALTSLAVNISAAERASRSLPKLARNDLLQLKELMG